MVHATHERTAGQVSERAQALHTSSIVIDATSFFLRTFNDRLRAGGLTATNFTTVLPWDDFGVAVTRIRDYYDLARRDPNVRIAWGVAEIEQANADGAYAAILGTQNSRFLGTEVGGVELVARAGLRVVQLTYNERNFAADGCLEPNDAGLSHWGRVMIKELSRNGIVLDLSHCGVRSSLEAMAASTDPVIISHAGVHSLSPGPRSLTDDQMKALRDTGGVFGVTTYGPFNWRGGDERPSIDNFFEAVDYAVSLIGIDHVGIGTDHVAEPGEYPAWVRDQSAEMYGPYNQENRERGRRFAQVNASAAPEEQLVGFRGIEDFPHITDGLLQRGYKDEDVQKILGLNLLRVFRQVWSRVPR